MRVLLQRVALFLLLATSLFAETGERILSFDSQITVVPDGTVLVRETIKVNATGNRIRHGIYRDFPTKYKDRLGNDYTIGFSIVAAELDGFAETYRTEPQANGVRIYFGDSKYFVQPGEHTYIFSYAVNREIGFFPDHDELYWNVTGNNWDFPIDSATATVILPPIVRAAVRETGAYTGFQGERGQDFTTSKDDNGNLTFQAADLKRRQGITIVVTWPKGLIAAPTTQQQLNWFFHDNQGAFVGLSGTVVVFFYFLLAWMKVGRDPKPGTIVPLYEPPDNLSPTAMRYLKHMKFDDKAFSAGMIGLAAKGYLKIRRDESLQYQLVKNESYNPSDKKLSADESLLAREIFEDSLHIYLSQENRPILNRARTAISLSLKTAMENVYFVTNSKYMWPGVILTVLFIGGLILTQANFSTFAALFMTVWLTGWTAGVAALLTAVYKAWRTAIKGDSVVVGGGALFLTLFSIPFIAGECFGAFMLYKAAAIPTFVSVMGMLACNVVFHFLLKAPTAAGRQLLDRIDGFKLFLSAVDGDRLKRFDVPTKTPELFERFLPYAFALDMEQHWAEQFSQVLSTAAGSTSSSSNSYCPSWYVGGGFGAASALAFTQSFGSSFSTAVSSSTAAPGSSSGGGGGGSSGGGGGGGGGGGW